MGAIQRQTPRMIVRGRKFTASVQRTRQRTVRNACHSSSQYRTRPHRISKYVIDRLLVAGKCSFLDIEPDCDNASTCILASILEDARIFQARCNFVAHLLVRWDAPCVNGRRVMKFGNMSAKREATSNKRASKAAKLTAVGPNLKCRGFMIPDPKNGGRLAAICNGSTLPDRQLPLSAPLILLMYRATRMMPPVVALIQYAGTWERTRTS